MISKEISEFIGQIKKLDSIGCILVAETSLKKLVAALEEAVDIVSLTPIKGRVVWRVVDRKTDLTHTRPPAVLVITEKEYSSGDKFAEKVREKAGYFINVA